MFSLTYVQLKYWFYPTGNTPAVNLLRDTPAACEQETINILSLGCGDPRNILFSLWCEQGHESKRSVRFTSCDVEPAVLAQNVVLLTSIADNLPVSRIWQLFYHFYVPEISRELLRQQATRLLEASKSIEDWRLSEYAKSVRWVNRSTLQQLRPYWAEYAPNEEWSQARTAIMQRSHDIGHSSQLTGIRAAGPLWSHPTGNVAPLYRRY